MYLGLYAQPLFLKVVHSYIGLIESDRPIAYQTAAFLMTRP